MNKIDALFNTPVNLEDLLLTDEKIWTITMFIEPIESIPLTILDGRAISKAQLAHCEPLIRADERAKVLKELSGWKFISEDMREQEIFSKVIKKMIGNLKQGKATG